MTNVSRLSRASPGVCQLNVRFFRDDIAVDIVVQEVSRGLRKMVNPTESGSPLIGPEPSYH